MAQHEHDQVAPTSAKHILRKQDTAKRAAPASKPSPASVNRTGMPSVGQVLHLQRTIGNHAVERLISQWRATTRPEPKLTTGALANDTRHEEVATALRKTATIRQVDQNISFDAGHDVEQQLSASRNSGSPLPVRLRSELELKFGADFSNVRVHTGTQSDKLNRKLGAQAFTHSNHIYMGAGKYNPGSGAGKQLLAHELTHVVQQGGGRAGSAAPGVAQTKVSVGAAGDRYEHQADAVARDVARHSNNVSLAPLTVQRMPAHSIQCKLDITVDTLENNKPAEGNNFIKSERRAMYFDDIRKVLADYHKQYLAKKQLPLLEKLESLAKAYTKKYGSTFGSQKMDVMVIHWLLRDVKQELPMVRKQAAYIKSNRDEQRGKNTDWTYKYHMGGIAQLWDAPRLMHKGASDDELREHIGQKQKNKDLTSEEIEDRLVKKKDKLTYAGGDSETARQAREMGLNDVDLGVIRGYTGELYKAINPALEGNKNWMRGNLAGRGTEHTDNDVDWAMVGGKVHGEMLGYALGKLPDYKGATLYRGLSLEKDELNKRFPVGSAKPIQTYLSCSKDRSVSQTFLLSNLKKQREENTDKQYIGVLIIIDNAAGVGKDLGKFHVNGEGEAEVLVTPIQGAIMKIIGNSEIQMIGKEQIVIVRAVLTKKGDVVQSPSRPTSGPLGT